MTAHPPSITHKFYPSTIQARLFAADCYPPKHCPAISGSSDHPITAAVYIQRTADDKHQQLRQKRILYEQHAVQKAGSEEYDHVWHAARDSIHLWVNNRLSGFDIYADFPWYLDSLICFNKAMNCCIVALSYQQGLWSPSDGMDYFNSAKINDRWCFFLKEDILCYLAIIISQMTGPR